jgi:two-component system, LytTR family, response regulator AlgR
VERLLRDVHPDAMLLDIEMPGMDGLTLARRMEAEHPEVPVVLVTAHAGHAVAAFDADVRDYVLKPVRRERLERALGRLGGRRSEVIPRLRLTIGRREQIVPLDELDCLVAEDGYVIARSAKIEGFVDSSLQELEARLEDAVLRVHRSILAVKSSITGIEARRNGTSFVLFRHGVEPIAVSRRQVKAVRQFLDSCDSNRWSGPHPQTLPSRGPAIHPIRPSGERNTPLSRQAVEEKPANLYRGGRDSQ